MKTKAKLLCSSLLLSLIIMLPAAGRRQSTVPPCNETAALFEQIDIEFTQRNVEECYRTEKRNVAATRWSGRFGRDPAQLDSKVMQRVLRHLAGTPEHDRFVLAYRTLVRRPDYRRLYTDELFVEYMRLLDFGLIRLLTQLKEQQGSPPEKRSAQAQEISVQSIPVMTDTFGLPKGSQRTESARVVPAVLIQVQVPLGDFAPPAVGRKGVSRIVADRAGQPRSAGTAVPTIDMAELNALVPQERVVLPEEVSIGHHHGWAKGRSAGKLTTLLLKAKAQHAMIERWQKRRSLGNLR